MLAVALVATCALRAMAGDPFVEEHNRVRERVSEGRMPAPKGVQPVPAEPLPPLRWDAELAKGAQAWASRCTFAHSAAAELGENLYASAGTSASAAAAVARWGGESGKYTYAAVSDPINDFDEIGHYTQLVWSTTTRLGCAITHCTSGSPFPRSPTWDLVVCRYAPAGNVVGQYPYPTRGVDSPASSNRGGMR